MKPFPAPRHLQSSWETTHQFSKKLNGDNIITQKFWINCQVNNAGSEDCESQEGGFTMGPEEQEKLLGRWITRDRRNSQDFETNTSGVFFNQLLLTYNGNTIRCTHFMCRHQFWQTHTPRYNQNSKAAAPKRQPKSSLVPLCSQPSPPPPHPTPHPPLEATTDLISVNID